MRSLAVTFCTCAVMLGANRLALGEKTSFSQAEREAIGAFLDEHFSEAEAAVVVGLVDERGSALL
jgi:hypothetical protein